jgi:hypothetical protein
VRNGSVYTPAVQALTRPDAPSMPGKFDQAAAACLARGGTVYAVPDRHMPEERTSGRSRAAALLRF